MPTRSVTICIDSREQKPLLFPANLIVHTRASWFGSAQPTFVKVTAKTVKLPAGDYLLDVFGTGVLYALQHGEKVCTLLETKRSIDELTHNVSAADRSRSMSALNRFCDSCEHPILMFDFLPLAVWQSRNPQAKSDPIHALDVVLDIVAQRGIHLIWGSRNSSNPAVRRRLGEITLRLLLHFSGVV